MCSYFRQIGVRGAGKGAGMLRGAGDSPSWKVYWFIGFLVVGFLVLKFIGFLASRSLGFLVSKFQSFLVSKFQRFKKTFNVFKRYRFHITKFLFQNFWKWSIPHPNLFKNILAGSTGCSGLRLFENFQKLGIITCWYFQNNIRLKQFGIIYWILWGIVGSPKIEINGFGIQGHVRKSQNHRNEGVWGFSHKQIEKL